MTYYAHNLAQGCRNIERGYGRKLNIAKIGVEGSRDVTHATKNKKAHSCQSLLCYSTTRDNDLRENNTKQSVIGKERKDARSRTSKVFLVRHRFYKRFVSHIAQLMQRKWVTLRVMMKKKKSRSIGNETVEGSSIIFFCFCFV